MVSLRKFQSAFRYSDGMLPNLAIIAYTLAGYAGGVWLLTVPGLLGNAVGFLALTHALTVSAYLIHDCTHGTIFAKPVHNDRLAAVMSWLNGACLAPYEGLKHKHLRHHADRIDVTTFDYRGILKSAPAWVRDIVLALEWAYVPAVEFLMRGLVVYTQVRGGNAAQRRRVLGVLGIRIALFVGLGIISLKALLLYALAYCLFLHILRFQDAFQHTFDVFIAAAREPLPPHLRRDRAYEHANTYSDVVSYGHPWINLLLLNFSYHNAHHAKPAAPWYELPRLHRTLYADSQAQILPCRTLLRSYHKYRVTRVLADDYGVVDATGDRTANFLGAVGVSFLTAI